MFPDLEMVKQVDGLLPRGLPLRLYRSRHTRGAYRYHFGFPREIVEPVASWLEPAWGTHWHEDGDFWLWWLPITGGKVPRRALSERLRRMIRQYNWALSCAKGVQESS